MTGVQTCALPISSSDACSQPIARASDSLSLSGFDFEVSVSPGKKNLEKTGGLDTAKISPSNGNGYDPAPGWQKLLALWPSNGRMNTNLAAQYWSQHVTSLEAETAWLAAVARYAGSDQVKRGVIMALPKFLASDRTQDTWPESEETVAQRRKNELCEYERSNKL